MLTREELARAVLELLKIQKTYFRIRPDDPAKRVALEDAKAAEKDIKAECERILEGPTLFGMND